MNKANTKCKNCNHTKMFHKQGMCRGQVGRCNCINYIPLFKMKGGNKK